MTEDLVSQHIAESKSAFELAAERASMLEQISKLRAEIEVTSTKALQRAQADRPKIRGYAQIEDLGPKTKNAWKDCSLCGLIYYKSYCDCRVEGLKINERPARN